MIFPDKHIIELSFNKYKYAVKEKRMLDKTLAYKSLQLDTID